jgi:ribonucleotide reductase alpha subunit
MMNYSSKPMQVIKRNGEMEPVQFDKVLERIRRAALTPTPLDVDYTRLAKLVIGEIHDGIQTGELDELAASHATSFMTTHPDWATLASRLIISNCQRNTPATFSEAVLLAGAALDPRIVAFVQANASALNSMIQSEKDYLISYFGFKTLEKSGYLLHEGGRAASPIVETPQYMWLRVAVGIHASAYPSALHASGGIHAPLTPLTSAYPSAPSADPLDLIKETYDLMSSKAFTHATPTLFNAGTNCPQLSSCFLVAMKEDSIEGIFDTLKQCAQISKYSGGIGVHIHNIRAAGSHIAGTNGTSNGIVPFLKVFNETAAAVNQGGKREGSIAIYLEPWHADIQQFIMLKRNSGAEDARARKLHYALWVPDLFMRRVKANEDWSLFCPHEAPGLSDVVGSDFNALYERYEATPGLARARVSAQKLWLDILTTQTETGEPYLVYKDAANLKSNQQNLGVIKSSNLCVAPETLILTDKGQLPIASLEGQEVRVWNGEAWSLTTVHKTGESQKLITVLLDDGKSLQCTPYHKFLLRDFMGFSVKDARRIAASDLKPGIQLKSYRLPKDDNYARFSPTVVSVTDEGRIDDTYCFNEPENHAGVFNGILTGNCSEIIEYSDPKETAVCNLASIGLPYFLGSAAGTFNFSELRRVVAVIVRNLNRVIDINFYPTEETKRSNMRHRPIGIGVQGLADVFAALRLPWDSPEAARLNRHIFEHIYFAAVSASCDLAIRDGPYETFPGSPASRGQLQYHLWGLKNSDLLTGGELDWTGLVARVMEHGIRNSLLMAPMPTASTSQILGNNECIEPITSNFYVRRVKAGEFIVINNHLINDLIARGLWSHQMKEMIVAANGSIQDIAAIPPDIKLLYRTVWELKQRTLIDLAADRAPFICQSQSLNLFVAEPSPAKLSSMHFYAWEKGLKTGQYYLRTKQQVHAIKFTVDPSLTASEPQVKAEENCVLCSS